MSQQVVLCWLRRDLRLDDNAALYHALKSGFPVVPVFVFDTNILNDLTDKHDRRVTFIYEVIEELQTELIKHKSSLDVFHGTPAAAFNHWISKYKVHAVYTNRDYEPYATERDTSVAGHLKEKGVEFFSYKDQVILDRNEVLKDNGNPYTIFTPYSRQWNNRLTAFHLKQYPVKKYLNKLHHQSKISLPSLTQLGFKEGEKHFPSKSLKESLIRHYDKTRDFPAINGTSRLGIHLRFGTISIRKLMQHALEWNETYAKELVWREFYQMIIWHFPHVVTQSFKKEYDKIAWRNNEKEFERWCTGTTGYPIVDAGMRELNTTGYMHNRVRMITASFLTKHLLIDWRWGEAYFAEKLLDYDLAANNGGWQWAAGSGCDAAPYFRVFNPTLQMQKFDKDLQYVRKWVPEFESPDYPLPVVSHEEARKRALEVYSKALKHS
ncbi:deoxyribodipyrimidine photo-lyase [Chitinophaga silvatica]|uniref:Deoxyribodipyrimidine photo-lyase n=1 Tax=Chitinophaga silvatica TaxID=2282649 RepID=A0A3E1YE48_9BACT|nr:deoxyribodipyrimidine photo-lyase [Chitinophaga silvatica]RFS24557.1 deoxyribodipyrimidine photo-lyase [Chitinophaga silvatica]